LSEHSSFRAADLAVEFSKTASEPTSSSARVVLGSTEYQPVAEALPGQIGYCCHHCLHERRSRPWSAHEALSGLFLAESKKGDDFSGVWYAPLSEESTTMRRKNAAYYRRNPLTTTELVVGGLVGAAALGIGGYLLYQYFNPTPAAALASGPTQAQLAANPALASYESATVSPGAPAGTNPGGYPVVSS
jgi:hypothetical protein